MGDENTTFFQNAFRQTMSIFITPEVIRRQNEGRLPKPLDLKSAQVIFFPDGRKNEVRINEEIKAIATVKYIGDQPKRPNDPVYENEIGGVADIKLTDADDPDCGHITFMKANGVWFFTWDCRYNKGLSKTHLESARQFLELGKTAFNHEWWPAFVDNLFSAAELAARAMLLLLPDPKFRQGSSHGGIHSKYNGFARLGNVQIKHAKTFNQLSSMRSPARYLKRKLLMNSTEAKTLIESVEDMICHVERRISANPSDAGQA